MWNNLGKLTVQGVRVSPDGLVVSALNAAGEQVTLTFDVEPGAPYRLRGVGVEVG